ncbi:MAG TPA: M48 family metallopeptidase [Steroidobacteraceae bacterium]|nr:M48 family metallopeptidase [Steroidobacteraceae bacterium]
MDHVYPAGPTSVPPNLTAATAAYKHRAWLAMGGLAAFIALYFALSGWFAWTAWRLFDGMFGLGGKFDLFQFVAAVCAAFLAVFMLKALFFIQHRFDVEDIEITRQDQPLLFDFIDRLADEARAPRAHKVYLSARVNAAVFYDLSLLNLIIPSKKNLEIGLGLVNVVTLGELKAVLAHEFGHFAQRSMAVGRWVYISQQIAGHVVARRDALDRLLARLSRFDLRIAWVGWLLSIIIWSIRSMMDVLFRGVLLAQRALSRQMEFQADLVAVSLTGSDALIHALHKLSAADDAWDKALSFANTECSAKRGITDLFAVQTRIIERMREILNQPLYGQVPALPDTARDSHRVFKTELAQPPRMWGTHPPSADRENNAKQRYVAAPVDDRSAWEVFRNPQGLKEQMSAHVFRNATVEPTAMEKTFQQLEKQYGRAFLNRAYRGVYLHRSPVRYAGSVDALYGAAIPPANLARVLDSLYPEDLAHKVELLNEKLEEKHALVALRDQVAQAPGGIIRHNGVEIRRNDLPRAIASLEREITVVRGQLETHDKLCRSAHLSAANILEKGWPAYLRSLATMLHYADHTEANLRDVQGYVANIYSVVTADGRVSSKELNRLLEGCQQLYSVLSTVHAHAQEVTLDRTLLRRLEVESWAALLEEFKLPPPDRENIGQWLNVIDGWMGAAIASLARLRDAALEQLLLVEGQVAKFARENLKPADAPPPSVAPKQYSTLLPGKERPRQKRLDWWDRFQTADGIVATIARSAVALGIVGSVIAIGAHVGSSSMTIYNALGVQVFVEVSGQKVSVNPNRKLTVTVPVTGDLHVRASTPSNELIEEFAAELHGANARYVYNVAGAVPLYEWTAVYTPQGAARSSRQAPAEKHLGTQRWYTTSVDHVFEEPPESIQTSSSSSSATLRDVLSAASDAAPWRQVEMLEKPEDRSRLIMVHARWDSTSSPAILDWFALASEEPGFDALFAARLKQKPNDVVLLRFEQDSSEGDEHQAVCKRQSARAEARPAEPDLQYLRIRCIEDFEQKNAQFLLAHEKWSDNPWLSLAAGATHAERGDYPLAQPLYEKARSRLPAMGGFLILDTARLRRLNSQDGKAKLTDLTPKSEHLAMLVSIETGRGLEGTPLEPYVALARGNLEAAVRQAKEIGDGHERIIRLVASSDRASRAMMESALALPLGESDGYQTAFAMYAIAVRLQRDPAPYSALLVKTLGGEGESVVAFLDTIRRGGDPAQAAAALPSLDLQLRMHALHTAVIMLGNGAPEQWRVEASRGLFVGERGYLARSRESAS